MSRDPRCAKNKDDKRLSQVPKTKAEMKIIAERVKRPTSPEKKKRLSRSAALKTAAHRVTVEAEVYLREQLLEPDKNGKVYLHEFIDTYLKEAKENPNSRAAALLASCMFNEDTLKRLDAEVDNQMAKDIAFTSYRVRQMLYNKQQLVYDDNYDHIMAICGRRSGKTVLNSRLLIKSTLKPNSHALYVNLSFDNAVRQLWDQLLAVCKECGINVAKANKSAGFIELANGSDIQFRGNNNKAAIDLVRGYNYNVAILDEIQNQCQVRYAIDDVLEPALRDNKGVLYLTGTPPRDNYSYVKELWNSGAYHTYNWNMTDNPYILDHLNAIKEICEAKHRDENDPLIQREYFGRFVQDTEAQVYEVTAYAAIPSAFQAKAAYIGVDTGFTDFNGICTLLAGYENNKFKTYIIDEHKFNHSTIETIAQVIKENISHLNVPYQVIVDQASHQIAYELQQTYNINYVYCAYKYDEALSIAQLQDLFKSQTIVAPAAGITVNEAQRVMWKRSVETDELLNEIDDDNYHADLLDAVRYASRQIIFDFSNDLQFIEDKEKVKSATLA